MDKPPETKPRPALLSDYRHFIIWVVATDRPRLKPGSNF